MVVRITDDFDLRKICDSGQCFRCMPIENSIYRFISGEHVLYIQQADLTEYKISCSSTEWEQIWFPYFDLGRSYRSIREQAINDPFLARAAAYGKGIRILRQDPWETLISFIISQQKTIPAIRTVIEKLSCKCGELITAGPEEVYTFPSPAAVREADLKELKLGYREKYVKAAALHLCEQPDLPGLWETLGDESLLHALKELYGVGDKIANCVMLFAYGRTACAPVDTWIHKIIEKEYQGRNPFPGIGENAGIVQQYAFYYAQRHKGDFK